MSLIELLKCRGRTLTYGREGEEVTWGSIRTYGMQSVGIRFVDLGIENRNDTRVSVRRTSGYY